MNNEQKQQFENIARILLIGIFAYLYAQGGMEGGGGLWLRRYLAPAILGRGCYLLSFNWRYLVAMPLQMATLTVGYGGSDLWVKVFKRGLWGLLNGASFSFPIVWMALNNNHYWAAVISEMIFVLTAAISLGVWNPLASARAEEFCIGVVLSLIPVMCAKRKS